MITDPELVLFLQETLPRLGLRWEGFRRVRSIVRKRLRRRLTALGLDTLGEYRAMLERDPSEWRVLEVMCRIPISRFYRDRGIFDRVASEILPARARAAEAAGRATVRIWSAGCASGEEPYTLAVLWHLVLAPAHPTLALDLVATDADEAMLARAARARYPRGSLKELPAALLRAGFQQDGDALVVRDEVRAGVSFERGDLRRTAPDGPFDLVMCRNVAFTYFAERDQRGVADAIAERLLPAGLLVVGAHERIPDATRALTLVAPSVYARDDRGPG